MARAKRTDRAEARRRHRAAQPPSPSRRRPGGRATARRPGAFYVDASRLVVGDAPEDEHGCGLPGIDPAGERGRRHPRAAVDRHALQGPLATAADHRVQHRPGDLYQGRGRDQRVPVRLLRPDPGHRWRVHRWLLRPPGELAAGHHRRVRGGPRLLALHRRDRQPDRPCAGTGRRPGCDRGGADPVTAAGSVLRGRGRLVSPLPGTVQPEPCAAVEGRGSQARRRPTGRAPRKPAPAADGSSAGPRRAAGRQSATMSSPCWSPFSVRRSNGRAMSPSWASDSRSPRSSSRSPS